MRSPLGSSRSSACAARRPHRRTSLRPGPPLAPVEAAAALSGDPRLEALDGNGSGAAAVLVFARLALPVEDVSVVVSVVVVVMASPSLGPPVGPSPDPDASPVGGPVPCCRLWTGGLATRGVWTGPPRRPV